MSKSLIEMKERASKDINYKTWLYNKIDGKMESIVVTMDGAEELYNKGWKLSPAEFHEELGTDPKFQVMASDLASKMNQLINHYFSIP